MADLDSFCNLTRTPAVATLEFSSPVHNAMSSTMLDQMADHIQSLDQDPTLKMILIQSAGDKTFCAGANLQELLAIEDEASGTAFFYRFARLILIMRASPHLILCRVQGKTIGGGLGIIAAADFVIASESAQLRLSELLNGIGPFVVGPAIERKIGVAAFGHMSLSPNQWMPASRAETNGLYDEVTPDLPALDQAISDKLEEWSGYSRQALQGIKRMLWSGSPDWQELLQARAAISGHLIMTSEARTALGKLRKG
ncbi:MAG: enoyl-CoA hydratase/isomerase family protein [Saprospiraceae bacterium]|nr:enoyl-CoA hydratase/isomerase family protein [Saprospiraceae bacterium]